MNSECRGYIYHVFLSILLAATVVLSGCTNPEKAKAEHVRKGEAYLSESKFQEASLEFRNAIQIDDQLAQAHWGLARAFEGLQRFPEMFEELRKTVSLDKGHVESRVKLGNYYIAFSRGKAEVIAEGERLAKEVLEKDPNHIEGHILMGTVFYAQKQTEKAFAELKRAIELDPKRVDSYLSLARYYIATKDQPKAEELFRNALSINPDSSLAHSEYGRFLVQNNRAAEGEAELRKAVEVGPTDRPARFMLASYYLVTKQLDKAEENYRALSDLDKNKPEGPLVLADFYAITNRFDDSIKIYQDVLAKSPDYLAGRYRLAEIMLMRGDTQGATSQIDEALKKDAKDRQALLLRARVRAFGLQEEGLKAAIEDLNEVLKQDPNSRSALYFISQAYFNLGMINEARTFTGDLERNYPDYLPAKLLQVQIIVRAGDPKTAVAAATSLLDRLSKTLPDRDHNPQMLADTKEKTYLARATAQMRLGNTAAARQDLELARQVAPSDPNIYNALAVLSINEKKPDEAVGFYEAALNADATNFNALNGLILLYAQRQELGKAHERIDQVLSSNPNKASVHFLKAQVYGYQRDVQGTETELRKALELDPNYLAAYSALGALFVNTKQEDRAIAEYRKIIERRPDNAMAYTLIGMLEDARKNYDVAAENYRKALEKDQNAIIAANNLAWLYAVHGKGNLDEAVRLAQGVVQKNPNGAGFIDTLGWVYYKKGLHGAAVEQLQKAVEVDEAAARANKGSPSATYRFHLGMALKAKGDKEASRRELQAALKLGENSNFPDAEEARKALATL
jgi:tetratricopeptide (TPR) repeat protein